MADDPTVERLSWSETRALIRSDRLRLAQHLGQPDALRYSLYNLLSPGLLALLLHRLARYAYLRGWAGVARLVALFALYLTRAEIPPTTSIGPSAIIFHPTCCNIFGRLGARVTITGCVAVGGGMDTNDIGGGPGYPVVGDDVMLGYGCSVLGSIRIGDRVRVGPQTLVTFDVDPDALVLWERPRVVRGGVSAGRRAAS